jgi:nucleotide-binding universal stress UspA family protein
MTDNGSSAAGAIVAGFDGSPESWAAVRVAAWEAERRHRPLVLAHGYFERLPYAAYGWSPYQPVVEDVVTDARGMLADAAKTVTADHPGLTVHTQLSADSGAGMLVQASRVAGLVVVGARGHGGFAGLSLGSVAAQTAAHASCPVLVVRGADDAEGTRDVPKAGPVVVGLDRSEHDRAALRFGFEEAAMRGVPVIGVHVWWYATDLGEKPDQFDQTILDTAAKRVVDEAMAAWTTQYPGVAVEHRPIRAMNPSFALLEESANAGLVVVGCRGRGGFASLLLGSVGRDVIGHAEAPVAVVHDHA